MIGSRPLEEKEIAQVLQVLKNDRDKCLFIMGIRTGFRISELLSLKIQDVVQYGKIRDSVTVERRSMKGKQSSRTVVLHKEVKEALMNLKVLSNFGGEKVFPICRAQASRIIRDAAEKVELSGKVTTHSMRKSFAKKMYERLDKNLVSTQKALGHKNVSSTVSYLSFDQGEIDKAILGE